MGQDGKLIESVDIDQWRSASSSQNNFNSKSMHEAMNSQAQKEPKIAVKMKHRTTNKASDDFKFLVSYEVELSKEEQNDIKNAVPSTPKVRHGSQNK